MSNTREIGREDGEIGPNDQYDEWKRSDIPGRASALPVQQIPTGYDIPGRAGARQVQQIPTGCDIPGFAGALPVQQIPTGYDIPGFAGALPVRQIFSRSDPPETQAAKRFLLSFDNSEEDDDKVIPTRSRCSNRYEPYRFKDMCKTGNRYDRRKDGHDRRGEFEQDDDFCRSGSNRYEPYRCGTRCDTIPYADSIESLRREVEILIGVFRTEAAKNNKSYAYFNQRFLDIERTIYPEYKVNMTDRTARKMYNERKLDTNGSILNRTIRSIDSITKLMQESRDPVKISAMEDTLKDLELEREDTLKHRSKIRNSLREPMRW